MNLNSFLRMWLLSTLSAVTFAQDDENAIVDVVCAGDNQISFTYQLTAGTSCNTIEIRRVDGVKTTENITVSHNTVRNYTFSNYAEGSAYSSCSGPSGKSQSKYTNACIRPASVKPTPTFIPIASPTIKPALTDIRVPVAHGAFIVQMSTGYKLNACTATDGSPVIAVDRNNNEACSRWNTVLTEGNFFFIQNAVTGKNISPATNINGSEIILRPSEWTGSWTQWKYEHRGDYHGHLVNRATGKHIFIPGDGLGQSIELRPASWRGVYTRFRFEN